MNEVFPGIYIEEWTGVALLFWLGYILLFLFLRHLIHKRSVTRWILLEGMLICLLADRFLALYSGECWRLTMEWEFYIRCWRGCVLVLTAQILAGAAVLYWCKKRWSRGISFLGILLAGWFVVFYYL